MYLVAGRHSEAIEYRKNVRIKQRDIFIAEVSASQVQVPVQLVGIDGTRQRVVQEHGGNRRPNPAPPSLHDLLEASLQACPQVIADRELSHHPDPGQNGEGIEPNNDRRRSALSGEALLSIRMTPPLLHWL